MSCDEDCNVYSFSNFSMSQKITNREKSIDAPAESSVNYSGDARHALKFNLKKTLNNRVGALAGARRSD